MKSNLSILRELLIIAQERMHMRMYLALRPPAPDDCLAYGSFFARNGVWRLKMLADHDDGIHERIAKRGALAERIAKCAEDGFIAVIESGMDCDCVTYSGRVREIPATVYAYNRLYDEVAAWADGPFSFSIVKPSEARDVEYRSRDNVMEAYEDGHPHYVTAGVP